MNPVLAAPADPAAAPAPESSDRSAWRLVRTLHQIDQLALCLIRGDEPAFATCLADLSASMRASVEASVLALDRLRSMTTSPWFDACAQSSSVHLRLCGRMSRLVMVPVAATPADRQRSPPSTPCLPMPDPDKPECPATATSALAQLSRREVQVVALVSNGLSNKHVAAHLALSPNTIKRHLARVMRRVDVSSRTGLATWYAAATR